MSAAASILLPRILAGTRSFDFIGKGGMAEIYLARQKTELGPARRCVVKQILPELASDPAFSEMLVHEAKLAGRLSHGNVVQVFDLGREGERLFIAMEYVEGFDLNDLLRRCSARQGAASVRARRPCHVRGVEGASITPTGESTIRADRSASCIATPCPRTCSLRSRAR